jgi:hypothetical protein
MQIDTPAIPRNECLVTDDAILNTVHRPFAACGRKRAGHGCLPGLERESNQVLPRGTAHDVRSKTLNDVLKHERRL